MRGDLRPPAGCLNGVPMRKRFVILTLLFAALVGCGNNDNPAVQGAGPGRNHNQADLVFAQGMIPHHQQAIEMSDLALERAARPAVRALAERIKQAQQPEIDQMKGWLSDWDEQVEGGQHGGGHGGGSMGMMSEEEMRRLEQARGAEFDRLFLEGMIRHHEGAVEMARTELKEGEFPDAKELARRIVESQQAEIDEMRTLLAA